MTKGSSGGAPRPPGSESLTIRLERVIPTPVPGLVIWKFPRRRFEVWLARDASGRHRKRKVRSVTYSVTHESSGHSVMSGRHTLRLDQAMRLALALGDLPWHGRPVDWTLPIEELRKIDRVRSATIAAAGFVGFTPVRDKVLNEWAARHDIKLTLAGDDLTDALATKALELATSEFRG